jgi:hypothetical protein
MKKLGSIIGSIVTIAVLTGCGSQTAATFAPMETPVNTGISAQSAQGLKSFYTILTEKVFVAVDTNKDKSVSFEEFKAPRAPLGPGVSAGPINPTPDVTTQVEPTAPAQPAAPVDPLVVFLKIDKNKNGKISMAEARDNKLFLGVSATDLRKMFKPLFTSFDADKNNSVSKAEFIKAVSGLDQMMQQSMMSLFFTADRNIDNKLNFSEYEDLLYASFKAAWEIPQNAPTPAEPPATDPSQPQPAPPSDAPAQPQPVGLHQ